MRRLLNLLEEIIWPRGVKCLCCDTFSEGKLLCRSCEKALQAMRLRENEAAAHSSAYRYDGVAKQLVLLLKEDCVADAAKPLAMGMAEKIRGMSLPPDTVLTWVTMPDMRRKKRGIDHGRRLCETVAQELKLPVRQLLTRQGNIHTQRGLKREARLRNLAGTIICREQLASSVLLIDDVMTTGATAAACTEALLAAGAVHVYVVTATQAMPKHPRE